MKKLLLATLFSLPFVGPVAWADEAPFVALGATAPIAELTDSQLTDVQGGLFDFCFACIATNTAVVTQVNLSLASLAVLQSNESLIVQSNN